MMTYDYGNQFYSAWLQHVCGDALMHKGMTTIEPIGDVAEAILGLRQLCTECYKATPLPMNFLTLPVA